MATRFKKNLEKFQSLPDEKKTKEWPLLKIHFIQSAKVCVGMAEAHDLKAGKGKTAEDFRCQIAGLELVEKAFEGILPGKMYKELMQSPEGFNHLLWQMGASMNELVDHYLTNATAQTPTPGIIASSKKPDEEAIPSFCPNRTAEKIEELLKANPCIKHVYVPNEWLVNRLNEYGSKIIKRPFEEDDRFAIDFGGQECK